VTLDRPKLADPLGVIRAGRLPERTVPVCLALDLVEEYEELARALDAAQGEEASPFVAGSAVEIQRQMDDLREQMQAATMAFRLRALPRPRFNSLKREHPPRKDDNGGPLGRDGIYGANEDTFFEALLRLSIVDPVLDEPTFRLLMDERLSEAQFQHLTDVAYFLNVRRIDLPFSSAASTKTTTSDSE
jgi:hypothetical protein